MAGTFCADCIFKDVNRNASGNSAAQQKGASSAGVRRWSLSAPASGRLVLGIVLAAIGLEILDGANDGGESTVFELLAGLIGLASLVPGGLLFFSSLFGLRKRDSKNPPLKGYKPRSRGSVRMALFNGCRFVLLAILAGLIGLVVLFSNAVSA